MAKTGLDDIGNKMVDVLIEELSKYELGGSALAESIGYKINKNIITIDMNEYGIYLNSGTKPHMPPVDGPLNEWAKAKGINVWAVAMSIKKNGTKAKPFMDAFEKYDFSKFISDAMFNEVEESIDVIIYKMFE